MGAGGPAQGRPGEVERQPGAIREAIEDPRQVPAGARRRGRRRSRVGADRRARIPPRAPSAERVEMAGRQEALARGDHRRRCRRPRGGRRGSRLR